MAGHLFQADVETDEIVEDAIQHVWSSFESALLVGLIAEIEIPITTEKAMQKIYKMIAWSICGHDGDVSDNPSHLEQLTADAEPKVPILDPWARGIVQTKKAQVQDDSAFRAASEPTNTAPSVGTRSHRSSRHGHTVSSMGRTEKSSNTKTKSNANEELGATWNLDDGDPDSDYDNLNMTAHMFDLLLKTKKQKHKDPVTQVEVKDEFEILEESIKSAVKDLKAEKFVVDKHGNVTPLQPVRPEALPPFAVPLELNIANPAPSAKQNASAVSEAASHHKKKKKVIRVAGSRSIDDMFFRPANNLSTSLAGGDYITQLNPGVSVRVDDAVREGPPVPEDPKKLSRRAYLERATMHNSISGESMAASSVASRTGRDKSGLLADSQRSQELALGQSTSQVSQSLLTMKLPDVDALQGARKAKPTASTTETAAVDDSSLKANNTKSKGRLIAATVVPTKPSDKQVENLHQLQSGSDKPRPRDRDMPISMVPPSERKRLPAPALGKTTGHGLSPEKSKSAVTGGSIMSNTSSVANSFGSFQGRGGPK